MYLGCLEKKEFKMWRGTLFKKKNPGNVTALVVQRITVDDSYYVE